MRCSLAGTVVRSAQRAYNGCSSSIELGAQHAWPHQTTIKRKSHQTCKHGPALLFMVQCKSWVKTEAAAKRKFLAVRHSCTVEELHSTGFHKGPQDQRDSQKGWKNRKASCCTLLKRISKLSLRRSGQSTFTLKRVPHVGPWHHVGATMEITLDKNGSLKRSVRNWVL